MKTWRDLLGVAVMWLLTATALAAEDQSLPDLDFAAFKRPVQAVKRGLSTRLADERILEISKLVRNSARAGSIPSREAINGEVAEIEQFIADNPTSPYNADLRRQLGVHYRANARYGLAIDHWYAAIEHCRQGSEPLEREILAECLGELSVLLASLGRADELQELKEVFRGTRLDGGYRTMQFRTALEALAMMRRHPEISFRCGPFAVAEIARRHHGGYVSGISEYPSSPAGVSMLELEKLSREAGVPMRAALRLEGTEFVVPSVIHWADNHYAAAIAMESDRIFVTDPTFSMRSWLYADDVSEESSGVFLIPEDRLPQGWRWLSNEEASGVFGKGFSTVANPGNDGGGGPECDPPPPPPLCCTSGGGNGGTGGTGGTGPGDGGTGSGGGEAGSGDPESTEDCDFCETSGWLGMPFVKVSEPWINLWIRDRPYKYTPKYGPAPLFELIYKNRQASIPTTGFTRLSVDTGGIWRSPWFARIYQNPVYPEQITHYGTDGRELNYWVSEVHDTGGLPLGYENSDGPYGKPPPIKLYQIIQSGTPVGYEALRQNGWKEQYTNQLSDESFVLSALVNPQGEAIKFVIGSGTTTNQYNIIVNHQRLSKVVAADGAETVLYYDIPGKPQTLTRVVGPQGQTVTLTYDDNAEYGNLATIRDAAGILSRIDYDGWGYPNAIVTPYGTTGISIEDNTGADAHTYTSQIDRSIVIQPPVGNEHIYAMINDDLSGNVPASAPTAPTASGGEFGWLNTLDTTSANKRNTFYWGPAVSGLIPSNLTTLSSTHFKYARIKHWVAYSSDGSAATFLGDILSWERKGSPDGAVDGPATWYDYAGKPTNSLGQIIKNMPGTNNLPSVVAMVMPDGTTYYKASVYNTRQRPTSIVERYREGGSTLYRTNTFTYATNGEDRVNYTGGNGSLLSTYQYDSNRRLTNDVEYINVSTSRATGYTYDGSGRLTSTRYPNGNTISNIFSGDGLTRTEVRYDGTVPYQTNIIVRTLGQTYTWTGLNSTTLTNITTWTRITNPYGMVVTNITDGLHRLIERRWPAGRTEIWHYELWPSQSYTSSTGGRQILGVTAYINKVGGTNYSTIAYTYDALRRLAYLNDAKGTITEYEYCECGKPSSIIKASGLSSEEVTTINHDYLGRRRIITRPGGSTVTNTFDNLSRLISVGDALGSVTNVYDNLNRKREVWNAYGRTQGVLYNTLDQLISLHDGNGAITTNTYDFVGRLLSKALATGGTEIWGYATSHNLPTSYTSQISDVTVYGYHAAGWRTNEAISGVMTNRFVYNGAGALVRLLDGRQSLATAAPWTNGTVWRYDSFGRAIEKEYATNGVALMYWYDALGRMTNRWSKQKGHTRYQYDLNGNTTKVDYSNSTPDITFTFDPLNRMTNMVDAVGTTRRGYANGLLQWEDGPWSSGTNTWIDLVSYGHNTARHRSQMTISQPTGNAWTNSYAWDAAHRLSSVTSPGGASGYTYNTQGSLVKRIAYPSSFSITNEFDGMGRITDTQLRNSGGTILNRHGYAYNNGHQRTTLSRTNSSHTAWNGYGTATYDDAGELRTLNAYNSSGVSVPADNYFYGYDAGWNMVKRTNNVTVTTYSPNVLNQAPGAYDGNGNRTSGSFTCSYNDEDQLVVIESASSWKIELTYDGLGRLRVVKDYDYPGGGSYVLQDEVRYLYDGMTVVQERNSSNHPEVTYTRGSDLSSTLEGAGGIGGLLMRSVHSGSSPYQPSSHAFYHSDGNGNVTHLIRSDGAAYAAYKYDPFGRQIGSGGTLAAANRMRFSSKLSIESISGNGGLYYFGYRFYDPESQRWLSRDPLEDAEVLPDGPNLYGFVRNNPLSLIDSNGGQSYLLNPGGAAMVAEAEAASLGFGSAAEMKAAAKAAALAAELAVAKCKYDKEKRRRQKCNDIWHAQDKVCDQLYTPAAKEKCHKDNDKELAECLRNKGGKFDFDE